MNWTKVQESEFGMEPNGTVPSSLFSWRCEIVILLKFCSWEWMKPVRWLFWSINIFNLVRIPSSLRMKPLRWFFKRTRALNCVWFPRLEEMDPELILRYNKRLNVNEVTQGRRKKREKVVVEIYSCEAWEPSNLVSYASIKLTGGKFKWLHLQKGQTLSFRSLSHKINQ